MVLLIDVETTGLDFEKDRIIEVAAAVVTGDFTTVEESYSTLVWDKDYPAITPEITKLTGIRPEDVAQKHASPEEALVAVENLMSKHRIETIVAYNTNFDKQMLQSEARRQGSLAIHWEKEWLCAMRDLESNQEFKCWKLSHLALDRGIAVDPKLLHRAMGDVELMRLMLVKAGTNASALRAYNNVPWIFVTAMVPHPREPSSEEKRTIAKKHGYSWQQVKDDPRVFEKRWVKRIKETDLEKEKASCPLTIRTI